MKKIRNILVPLIIYIICIVISYVLVCKSSINLDVNNKDFLTHYGLFMGFGLTIYTFIISILDNIVVRIDKNNKITNKESVTSNLFSGISHLKYDVLAIFVLFILQLLLMTLEEVFNEFNYIFIILKYSFFLYSLTVLYDVCRVLFGIADVSILLIKNRKNESNN